MAQYGKITALYSRLSVGDEDRDGGESNSIVNQKVFLERYARQQKLTNIRHYIDDDESGRFFDRSAYVRMMEDVESGKIGVCIMKDMTRWGRDYLQVGNAMEVFRRNNVRFIAVNNGIDSADPNTLEFAPFGDKGLLAENYPLMRDWVEWMRRGDEQRPGGPKFLFDYAFTFGDWLAMDGVTEQELQGRYGGRLRRIFVFLRLHKEAGPGSGSSWLSGGHRKVCCLGGADSQRHSGRVFCPVRQAVHGHPGGVYHRTELRRVPGQRDALRRPAPAAEERRLPHPVRFCGRAADVRDTGGERYGGHCPTYVPPGEVPQLAPLRKPGGHHYLGAVELGIG